MPRPPNLFGESCRSLLAGAFKSGDRLPLDKLGALSLSNGQAGSYNCIVPAKAASGLEQRLGGDADRRDRSLVGQAVDRPVDFAHGTLRLAQQ